MSKSEQGWNPDNAASVSMIRPAGKARQSQRASSGTLDNLNAALQKVEKRKEAIERSIMECRARELAALPRRLGLPDLDSLILELLPHASPALRERLDVSVGGPPLPEAKGTRQPFSDPVRRAVEWELTQGVKPIAELSREYGPSRRTIMNWKRNLGLTNPRTQTYEKKS